jgi:uncharacterized membrane protein YeaQ/YmgE (transglycosylase-associated protein family)
MKGAVNIFHNRVVKFFLFSRNFNKKTRIMDLSSIIVWIVLGSIAGWLAGKILRGGGQGLIGNIIVGIIGSFVGGWLAGKIGISGAEVGGLSIASILTAVGGSVVLLFLLGLIKKG